MHYGYYGGIGLLGLLWMFVFWFAVIWLVVWLIGRAGHMTHGSQSPVDILKERYAKGEMTKKQFDEMKKDVR